MNNNRGLVLVRNKQGMALIVSLMTSFILLALVASLFWVIASTSRQAEYAKNSAVALNLAEAGTADAIYRLNYCTGTSSNDLYPFGNTSLPFSGTDSSVLVDFPVDILNTTSFSTLAILTGSDNDGIHGTLNGGDYYVGLLNENNTPDTLISVGVYKGVRRILTVPLRGNNDIILTRQPTLLLPAGVTQGISEAFNKHVIYANKVAYNAGTVYGNIVYANYDTGTSSDPINWSASGPTNPYTKTKVDPALFGVPDFTAPADLPNVFSRMYTDGNRGASGIPNDFAADGYGTYTLGTDTYVFNVGATIDQSLQFNTGTNNPVKVQIPGSITFNPDTALKLDTSGVITITSGITATGNLTIEGVPIILNNIIVNGAVLCDNAIILSGSASIINAETSTKEAAVLMESTADDTVTISASPIITLGSSQTAAVIAYSNTGAVGVSVNANLTPTMNSSQASIIAYAGSTNNATINIGSSAPANVNGLIYAYSTNAVNVGNITLGASAGNINGALVADGTVTLNGGILNYEIPVFTGASLGSDIFSGFSGGLRAYVPVWQGWRLR